MSEDAASKLRGLSHNKDADELSSGSESDKDDGSQLQQLNGQARTLHKRAAAPLTLDDDGAKHPKMMPSIHSLASSAPATAVPMPLWNAPPAFLQQGLAMQMGHPAAMNAGAAALGSQQMLNMNTAAATLGRPSMPSQDLSSLMNVRDASLASMWRPPSQPSGMLAASHAVSQADSYGRFPPMPPHLAAMYSAQQSPYAQPSLMGGFGPPGQGMMANTDLIMQQQMMEQRQQLLNQQRLQLQQMMQATQNPGMGMNSGMHPGLFNPAIAGGGLPPTPGYSAPMAPRPPQPAMASSSSYIPPPVDNSNARRKQKAPAKQLTAVERDKIVKGIKGKLICDVSKLEDVIARLKAIQEKSTGEALARFRDRLISDHEDEGQCRQCNRHRQLHTKWPLCLACLKHNAAHTKQFRQRYAVDPRLDLELFILVTLSRLLSNSRHQCTCASGPDIACDCVFNESTLVCIPCRFLRGVEWVIRLDLWN
eukprot:TRINITY_DN12175_c4_g1_i1.p1 TRINITY_DN12175_c4_g1~~TRINITY_DN12175_c4_g1_i1.p1  ORF type:complete len:479 (+),score=85.81 TRINITY_DN12175_c4_g1_i1:204-1640(+)